MLKELRTYGFYRNNVREVVIWAKDVFTAIKMFESRFSIKFYANLNWDVLPIDLSKDI